MKIPKELEVFFEMSDNGICLIGTDGYFKKVNTAFIKCLGFDEQYLLSRPFMEIVHPDDHIITMEAAKKIGIKTADSNGFTNRYLCADGSYRWLLWMGKRYNGFIIGVATDITEQKELAITLEETARLANVGGWSFDIINKKLTWNKQTYRIHEVPEGDEINVDRAIEFYIPEHRDIISKAATDCIIDKIPYDLELEIITAKGKHKYVRTIGRAKAISDATVMVSGVLQDITEIKKRDLALKEQQILSINASRLATLGEMAAGIAHEINNPLEIINVSSEVIITACIQDNLSTPVVLDKASKIKKTTIRIAKIIKGLKNFARDGSSDPFEATNLNDIINDSLSFCLERFKNNSISFQCNLDGTEKLPINCSPTELSQVLLNLLNNSFDAVCGTDSAEIHMNVLVKGDTIELKISDNGPGVHKSIENKIMNPFFTTKPVGRGTGIGLSISNSIVERHGGQLKFIPQKVGACFQVTLPLQQSVRKAV